MNLRSVIAWAMNNNVNLDDEVVAGDHYDATRFGGVSFNKTTNQIILLEKSMCDAKVIEMIAACQCTRAIAEKYLQESNWNVPLAIVTYRREMKR